MNDLRRQPRRQPWTRFDATYALVIVPLLIVAAMMISGTVSWREQTEQADQVWSKVISEISAGDSLAWANWYDKHKSKQATLKFKRAVEASDAIMSQLDACSPEFDPAEVVRVTPPNEPLPMGGVIRDLAEEAAPVLRLLASIPESEANVWHAIILEGGDLQLPNALQSRSLIRLLKIEFLDAYHEGETARAIDALSLIDRFYGPHTRPLCADDERVRRDAASVMRKLVLFSLAQDVWTEADLARIQVLVSRDFDWRQRWQDVVRGEMLRDPPWKDEQVYAYSPLLSTLTPKSRLAPSEKHELAKRHARITSTDDVATPRHYQKLTGIDQISAGDSGSARDRWIQFPQMNADWREFRFDKNYSDTAGDFADEAKEQRLTRCAVAVKQFAKRFDRLPDSLGEVAEFELLPPDDVWIQDRPRFRYQVGKDPDAAVLMYTVSQSTMNRMKRDRPGFWNSTVVTK